MIISLLNEKGGVGKTTISTNLAKAVKDRGHSVILIDSDPQGSARDWHAMGNGDVLEVVGLDRPTLDKDVVRISRGFDFAFIDGAPRLTNMAVKAILCSDLILIPVQPSPYDVLTSESLVSLIKQRQEVTGGNPKAAFVISAQIVNTRIGKEIRGALQDYGLPIFTNGTFLRVSYKETAGKGKTVLDSKDDLASKEMNLLTDELLEFINVNFKS